MPPDMTPLEQQRWREDAARFLRLLLSECGEGVHDHAWRRCRRCLAFDQLQGHQPLARKLVEVALAALAVPPEAPDCREAVRAALLEVRVSVTRRLCATASTRVAAAYACVRDDIDAKLADLERQPTREGPC